MRLIYDEYSEVWVWVESHDENIELSPHFDYKEDAARWHARMSAHFKQRANNEEHAK